MTLSTMKRRHQLRTIKHELLDGVKKACGSSWNDTSKATVDGHIGRALAAAEGLSCGSVWTESLPEISKLIRAKDGDGVTEAVTGAMLAWTAVFEETHDLSEVDGWTEHQRPRMLTLCEWFGSFVQAVEEKANKPKAKKGKKKGKKAAKKGGKKAAPKAGEPTMADLLAAINGLAEALK